MNVSLKKTCVITVNGVAFSGKNVSIHNGVVTVDGVVQDAKFTTEPVIKVEISGDVEKLETISGDVTVNGSVGRVKTTSGDIECGDIAGNAETLSGDIKCKKIGGKARTVSGDISGL